MARIRPRFVSRANWQQGAIISSPVPTRVVSNEEFAPHPQTSAQGRVEHLIAAQAERTARKLGIGRRDFLQTTGGMAAAFLAMNSVFGKFFDVLDIETVGGGGIYRASRRAVFHLRRANTLCRITLRFEWRRIPPQGSREQRGLVGPAPAGP